MNQGQAGGAAGHGDSSVAAKSSHGNIFGGCLVSESSKRVRTAGGERSGAEVGTGEKKKVKKKKRACAPQEILEVWYSAGHTPVVSSNLNHAQKVHRFHKKAKNPQRCVLLKQHTSYKFRKRWPAHKRSNKIFALQTLGGKRYAEGLELGVAGPGWPWGVPCARSELPRGPWGGAARCSCWHSIQKPVAVGVTEACQPAGPRALEWRGDGVFFEAARGARVVRTRLSVRGPIGVGPALGWCGEVSSPCHGNSAALFCSTMLTWPSG